MPFLVRLLVHDVAREAVVAERETSVVRQKAALTKLDPDMNGEVPHSTQRPSLELDTARVRTLGRRVLKASEVLVQTLLEQIVSQRLKDGDRLPNEAEMIAQYGVARATVREALRILELHGFVSLRSGPGGGPTVRSTTAADFGRVFGMFFQAERVTLAELFAARSFIEPTLVRDAALQQIPEFLERVRDLRLRGRDVDIQDDPGYVRITREFHELIVSGSNNRVFALIALAFMAIFVGRLDSAIHPPEKRRRILQEHEQILDAILAGNGALAESLMQRHMESVRKSIAARYPAAERDLIRWS